MNKVKKYLLEIKIDDYLLILDKEGEEGEASRTLKAAQSVGLKNLQELMSEDQFGIRMADMLAGVISKFMKALNTELRYKNQADGKNATQFLADSTEDKIIFYDRNLLRRALTKSHSKPASGSDRKQRLHDLITFILIDSHRILPGTDSLTDMSKKMICDHRTNASSAKSQK